MKHLGPFRVATYLTVLFFLGHTGGGMLAQKSLGQESDAVFAQMKSVHFAFNGATCTWYGFWFGFGLLFSAFLAFSAVASWHFSNISPEDWPSVALIAWALFAVHAIGAVLGFTYFGLAPGVSASLIAVLIAIGAVRKRPELKAP